MCGNYAQRHKAMREKSMVSFPTLV